MSGRESLRSVVAARHGEYCMNTSEDHDCDAAIDEEVDEIIEELRHDGEI